METIHLLEVFGGVGALARGMREKGLLAEIFDIRQSKFDNIHTDEVLNVAILTHKKTQVAIHWCESWYIQG